MEGGEFMGSMGATERQLEIIKYLCRKRYATMSTLADEFGVSVRTIQRDIEALTLFVPLDVKAGRYEGGVYVVRDYTMDRMYMTEKEVNVLLKIQELIKPQLIESERLILDNLIKKYSKPA